MSLANLAKYKILFIEDELLIALETEMQLRELGYESVDVASNLREAQKLADTRDYDIGVFDINVEGESSLNLARACSGRGMPIVFTTGYEFDPHRVEDLDCTVVRKPYMPNELDRAIRSALGLTEAAAG